MKIHSYYFRFLVLTFSLTYFSQLFAQDDLFSDRKSNTPKSAQNIEATKPVEGKVILLISSTGADDPVAAALQRSFRFASNVGLHPFPATVIIDNSSYETVSTAINLMKQDSVFLLAFAGDEGTAISLAMLSKEYKVPLLKISSDVRSLAQFSSYITEFLPSQETQSKVLGEFAAKTNRYESALCLVQMDERGRALAEGFKSGAASNKVGIDTVLYYPPETESVRKELEDLFSNQARLSHGKTPLQGAITAEERTELFGSAQGGEVLVSAENKDSLSADTTETKEAFLFGLSAEKINDYSQQLKELPEFTDLYGNSGWMDLEALTKNKSLTDSMYISVPLCPEPADSDSVLTNYNDLYETTANAWELLGLDAADFIGKILESKPKSRNDLQRVMRDTHFNGRAVQVNFSGSENQSARILRFLNGELKVVR